jgi:DNA-binding Xre family transcriptional regulator
MSSYELAERIGLSPTRVRELEVAEVNGSIRLSSLNRLAKGLHCTLFYVLVPDQSLELTVHRQARRKAAEALSASFGEDQDLVDLVVQAQWDVLTVQLMDRQGLWR